MAWYTLFADAPSLLANLHTTGQFLLKGCTACPTGYIRAVVEVKNNIALMATVCIALFEAMGELQRERLCQSRATAFSRNGWMCGQFCKWRAKYLRRSLVIVHTECSQWQRCFIWENLACLTEVSVTEQILQKFPNFQYSWGNWACTNIVYQALFFLCPCTTVWKWG